MDALPPELISLIGVSLPLSNLYNLLQTCTQYNKIFQSNNFWRDKFHHDINDPNIQGPWKESYKNYGAVYVFGLNVTGQLGIKMAKAILTPVKLPGIRAKFITASRNRTYIIDLDNNVWGMGEGISKIPFKLPIGKAIAIYSDVLKLVIKDTDGRLWRIGSQYKRERIRSTSYIENCLNSHPQKVSSFHHRVFIDSANDVWVVGNNGAGQLGLGDCKSRSEPVKLPEIKAVTAALGHNHTVLLSHGYK